MVTSHGITISRVGRSRLLVKLEGLVFKEVFADGYSKVKRTIEALAGI